MMKYIRFASRNILGIVFIFSGFVKAVDPLGSAYKFTDYFHAFRIGFLDFSALPLGIVLSAFELVLGITLILGYRRRVTYVVLLWFMSFFTLLTFILALFNPVSDCGCFGDALILTNWETFLKNLVLMLFVVLLYAGRQREWDGKSAAREWSLVVLVFAGSCFFSFWNWRHLPLIDFRPYDLGTVIGEEMEMPDGAAVDQYETTFIYRNLESGKEESFTIDNYPTDTSAWEFVTSESKLVKKGYEPPIHDFVILDRYGNDLVPEILADHGYTLLMISHDLSSAAHSALLKAKGWSELELMADDYSFHAVTASTSGDVQSLSSQLGLGYDFLAADDIMLKTVVRSNPGFVLIRNGIIIGKWGYRDFPAIESLDQDWNELIGNASVPVDEEMQQLIDEGILEEFSFDVMSFDRFLPALVTEAGNRKHERDVVLVLVLGILILVTWSHLIEPVKL